MCESDLTQLQILHFLSRGMSGLLFNLWLIEVRHRHMEDFVTWVDTSKLKRTIMSYNDEVSLQGLQGG